MLMVRSKRLLKISPHEVIIELTTTFLPAPGVDTMKSKSYLIIDVVAYRSVFAYKRALCPGEFVSLPGALCL
jgi:hypothetical protein